MTTTKDDPRQLWRVTSGPYKNFVGYLVNAAQVRGSANMAYLENWLTCDVYEVSPKHLIKYDGRRAA